MHNENSTRCATSRIEAQGISLNSRMPLTHGTDQTGIAMQSPDSGGQNQALAIIEQN